MILADTSVWIDHLRSGIREMREHLNHGRIVIHPFVTTELALGSLRNRSKTLALQVGKLALLLLDKRVRQEIRSLIDTRRLYGLGIGLTDAHLIA